MPRIAGVDIPNDKRVIISLTYIFGVGPTTASNICSKAEIDPSTRVKDLTEAQGIKLRNIIENDHRVEGETIVVDPLSDQRWYRNKAKSKKRYSVRVLPLTAMMTLISQSLLSVGLVNGQSGEFWEGENILADDKEWWTNWNIVVITKSTTTLRRWAEHGPSIN